MTAVELAIAVGLIGAVATGLLASHRTAVKRTRELVLQADLQALRAAVSFFEARRGARPSTLEEAAALPIGRMAGNERPGVWSLRDRGQALDDAFGTPYQYDRATGRVWSATAGYDNW
jgi:hypothetical protein